MGRTTFEPALTADRWPWPKLNVFVLGSNVASPDTRLALESQRAIPGGSVEIIYACNA
jgi:hypothetical protein